MEIRLLSLKSINLHRTDVEEPRMRERTVLISKQPPSNAHLCGGK